MAGNEEFDDVLEYFRKEMLLGLELPDIVLEFDEDDIKAVTPCCRAILIGIDKWIDARIKEMKMDIFSVEKYAHELTCGCPQYQGLVEAWGKYA